MVDISIYAGNNEKKLTASTVGTVGMTLPGNRGTLVSGTTYKIGTVPTQSVVTSVVVVVTDAFDGITPTADVSVGSSLLVNNTDLAVAGATMTAASTYVTAAQDINFVPTFTTTTKGTVRVVIEYAELDTSIASFTA